MFLYDKFIIAPYKEYTLGVQQCGLSVLIKNRNKGHYC